MLIGCSSSEPSAPLVDASTAEVAFDTATLPEAEAAGCKLTKPYSTKNMDCNACAEAKCCAEINGCLGDARCDDDYVNCILACALDADAGSACIGDCGTMFPAGKSLYDTAIGCADTKCATECK